MDVEGFDVMCGRFAQLELANLLWDATQRLASEFAEDDSPRD